MTFRPADSALATAREAMRDARPWVTALGRAGYAAKGVVYIAVGALAARAAAGGGRPPDGTRSTLRAILEQPFGQVALSALAVGLFGYALWKLIAAVMDAEGKGGGVKGVSLRLYYLGSGVVHGSLGAAAVKMLLGVRETGGSTIEQWTSKLLAAPWGHVLVAIVGVTTIGVGLYQLYKAYADDPADDLDTTDMSVTMTRWAVRLGRFGIAARGVLFVVLGALLLKAAQRLDARAAGDVGDALRTLRGGPFGRWVMGAVALGFVAYGLFQLVEARYRRLRV